MRDQTVHAARCTAEPTPRNLRICQGIGLNNPVTIPDIMFDPGNRLAWILKNANEAHETALETGISCTTNNQKKALESSGRQHHAPFAPWCKSRIRFPTDFTPTTDSSMETLGITENQLVLECVGLLFDKCHQDPSKDPLLELLLQGCQALVSPTRTFHF